MKVYKNMNGGIGFASTKPYEYQQTKYDADLKDGDIITILDGGNIEPNKNYPGESHNFRIKTRNGEKKKGFNPKTINVLIEEFGDETEKWVGKDVKVLINKTVIGSKKVDVCYFVTAEWSLDEYGEPVKSGVKSSNVDNQDTSDPEPSVDVDEEKLDPKDIPF